MRGNSNTPTCHTSCHTSVLVLSHVCDICGGALLLVRSFRVFGENTRKVVPQASPSASRQKSSRQISSLPVSSLQLPSLSSLPVSSLHFPSISSKSVAMGRVPRHLHKDRLRQLRRGEEDDEDSSDDESNDGGSIVATIADGQQRSAECRQPNTNNNNSKKKHTNEEGEEWGESQQKKDIIAAFLDENSGIHALSTTQIFEEYAADHGWIKVNATNNIRRLRKQYDSKEGPFSAKEVNKTEPFKTRKTKSKAYTLLLKLHMMSECTPTSR